MSRYRFMVSEKASYPVRCPRTTSHVAPGTTLRVGREAAQEHWRYVNGAHLVALVRICETSIA